MNAQEWLIHFEINTGNFKAEDIEVLQAFARVKCKEQRDIDLDTFKQWLKDFEFNEASKKLESIKFKSSEPEL